METAPSPSTNPMTSLSKRFRLVTFLSVPLKPLGTTVLFAVRVTGTDKADWPSIVAVKVATAVCTPVTWLQSTLRKTRSSGLDVEIEPEVDESCSQDALLVMANVNGEGPPAATST